ADVPAEACPERAGGQRALLAVSLAQRVNGNGRAGLVAHVRALPEAHAGLHVPTNVRPHEHSAARVDHEPEVGGARLEPPVVGVDAFGADEGGPAEALSDA